MTRLSHLTRRAAPTLPSLGRPLPGEASSLPPQGRVLRQIRALRRILWVALITPACCVIQATLLAAGAPARVGFAAFYWKAVARLIGLQIRVIGVPAPGQAAKQGWRQGGRQGGRPSGRPVIYVCNHSSWLDIPALGGTLRACFVAKDDVAGWPIVGTIARLGRTVFVSRSRQGIGRERDQMQARLVGGDDLILFPEGTSSDGSRVLAFHSSFFAAAYGDGKPLIQPVSVVYDRLAGLPVGRVSRAIFAWYGDMELAPHVWRLAQWRGKRVTLLFHPPLDPADFASRKALSQAAWDVVAGGAACLRQNRAAAPLSAGAPAGAPAVAPAGAPAGALA